MPVTDDDIRRQEREIAALISQIQGARVSPHLGRRFHEDPADELGVDKPPPRKDVIEAVDDDDDTTEEEESQFWKIINDLTIPTPQGGDTFVPTPFTKQSGVSESLGENVLKSPFTLGRGMVEMGYNVVRGASAGIASLFGGESGQPVEERTRSYWVPPSKSQQKYAETIARAEESTVDALPIVGDLKDWYEVGREFIQGRGKQLMHDQPAILPALAMGLIPGMPGPDVNVNADANVDVNVPAPLVDPVSPAQKKAAMKAFMDAFTSSEHISIKQERIRAAGDAVDPTTALNKAEIKKLLEQAGAAGMPDWEKQAFASTLSLAKANGMDAKALTIAETIRESKGKGHMITAEEHAGMVLKAAQLANDYDISIKESSDLAANGDVGGARVSRSRADATMKQIELLAEASDFAGRETARALSIRRMGVNREKFDLASVVQRAQSIKGRKLTPDEHFEFESLSRRHEEAQVKLSETEQRLAESREENARIRAEKIVAAEKVTQERVKRTQSRKDSTAKKRNSILADLKELGLQINFGLDPTQAYKVGQLAKTYIEDGVTEMGDLVGKVKERLPQLNDRDVYDAILAHDPDATAKARSELQLNITEMEKQARLLVGIEDIKNGLEVEASKLRTPDSPVVAKLRNELGRLKKDKRAGERVSAEIKSLEEDLAAAEQGEFRSPKQGPPKPSDQRVQDLRTRISDLKKAASKEGRENTRIAELEKELALAEQGEFKGPIQGPKKPGNPEIERIKARITELRQQEAKSKRDDIRIAELEQQIEAARKGESQLTRPRKVSEVDKKSSLALVRDAQKRLTKIRQQAWSSNIDATRLESGVDALDRLQDQLSNIHKSVKEGVTLTDADIESITKGMSDVSRRLGVAKSLAEAKAQIQSGDIVPRRQLTKKEIDPALERDQIELRRARQAIRNRQAEMEKPTAIKLLRETINTARTIKATADMSATFRQGLILAASHPVKAAEAFVPAFKSFFEGLANNDYTAQQVDNAIRSADHHYLRERAGLYLAPLDNVNINASEEMFASRWAETSGVAKWTGFGRIVKASEQHMVTFLNQLRTSAFDHFLNVNPNATQVELKAWADWINVASGRGKGKFLAQNANWMSTVVFAPRFTGSRIQAVNAPARLYENWKNPRVRKEIAKDYVKVATLGASALALGKLAGGEVGDDPRSSDFGKMTFGNSHVDVWGGMQQPMRAVSSILLNVTDRTGLTGDHLSRSEVERFNGLEVLGRFASFKLAPSVTLPMMAIRGKDVVGQKVTPTDIAVNALVPLVWQDVYDAYRDEGFGSAVRSGSFNFFGVGTNTYQKYSGRRRSRGRGSSRSSKRSGSR